MNYDNVKFGFKAMVMYERITGKTFIPDGLESILVAMHCALMASDKEFTKDYKDKMYLFKTKEFIDNKIFGLSENNMNILNNLGEYISLCNSDAQFINSPEIEEYYGKTKGNHSGLTQDEMIIPLIVINRKNDI